jgi:hypothetical protein
MGKLLLSILLVAFINLNAHEQPTPGSTEKTNLSQQYNHQLNLFLRKSDDIKIQLSAFSILNGQESNFPEIKKLLKNAISPSSDKYTIFLANRQCHNNIEITDWCHQKHIHNIHREIDPENIITYIFELNESENKDVTHEILKEVSNKATYSDSFFFEYILQMAKQIETFNINNPKLFKEHTAKDLQYSIDDIRTLQLIEKGIVPGNFKNHFNENTSIIQSTGIEMARVMPYRALTQACKEMTSTKSCNYIGQLLMQSNTLLDNMIGNAIIGLVQKQLGQDENTLNKTKNTADKISKQQMCYAQINNVTYAQMYNKNFMTQYIIDAKNKGELEAYRNLAYTVYNTEIKNGFNPDFDPKDCE